MYKRFSTVYNYVPTSAFGFRAAEQCTQQSSEISHAHESLSLSLSHAPDGRDSSKSETDNL